jgi:protein-tyrosine phosphatase
VSDTIYRGALPNAAGYRALVDVLDVRRVCSIIEHEVREDKERALNAGVGAWHHIPFSDTAKPSADRVREWFDYVRSSEQGGTVFTHCRGGRHRTGMLVAAYRVADCGWTKEQAFNEMMTYGWYAARGHQPLLDWFFNDFDPQNYRAK